MENLILGSINHDGLLCGSQITQVRYYVIKVTLETNFAETDPFSTQILHYDMLSPQKIDPNN